MDYKGLFNLEELNMGCGIEGDTEVTIYCNTYNQVNYLRDALDSFVAQKTDFKYEIVVFDDASTDGTDEVIREYVKKYPDLIKALMSSTNTYSTPQRSDFIRTIEKEFFRGKYVAFCEGDDYWTDENKLQLQRDALENHPECDMCACWGCTVTAVDRREVSQIRPAVGDCLLHTNEVILGGGQYLVSAGLFYRKSMRDEQMKFEKVIGLDYVMQIKGSLRGGIWYLDRKMAVYRRYVEGSWTMRVLKDKDKLEKQWSLEKRMLEALDVETGGKYHSVIRERLKAYTTFYAQLDERRDEICQLLRHLEGTVIVWGLGRRGSDFEKFCYDNQMHLDGVCDITNDLVGEMTAYGNRIIHTDEVLLKADHILATNSFVLEDLKEKRYKGSVINLQEYMPLG